MNFQGIASFLLFLFLSSGQAMYGTESRVVIHQDSLTTQRDTVTIMCVGDVMLGTDYPSQDYLPAGGDCSSLLDAVRPFMIEADIACGNLEGTFADSTGKPKKCIDTTQCFVFRMPDEFVKCLAGAGFDFLSLANNHSGDFGQEGRIRTVEILEAAGINCGGTIDHPVSYLEKNGIKFGFTAFSPHPGTLDLKNIEEVQKIIRKLDQECDIVIVSFHGGAEGKDHQHITKQDEIYLGFNRGNIYDFAHKATEAGADIVYGHGPHVTRALELYRGRIILYSLGNFCTYARFNLRGPNGIAPMIRVTVNREGKFINGVVYPLVQKGRGIPEIDRNKQAIRILRELTETDFPENSVFIDEKGNIFPAPSGNR